MATVSHPNFSSRNVFWKEHLAKLSVVFACYFLGGKLGLAAPFTHGNVSPVWPPAGIALAAVLVWGYGMWPAIASAAFLVNFFTPIPQGAAVAIAAGNTSSALLAAFLLRRLPGFRRSLGRVRDVLMLVIFGAVVSTTVAATAGVTTLYLTSVNPWLKFGPAWLVWWLGDGMGVLIVAPVILTFHALLRDDRWQEKLLIMFAAAAATIAIFDDRVLFKSTEDVLAFLVFPFIVWAAIRFGPSGASFTSLAIASIAVWETANGHGPFIKHGSLQNADLLQVFLAVISITGMLLAAAVRERHEAEAALAREQELMRSRDRAEDAMAKLAAIVESSDDAIIGKDLNGMIITWNAGAERLYGYTAEEAVGRHISILTPHDRPDEIPAIMEEIRRGEGIEHYETERIAKGGARLHVSLTVSAIRNRSGEIVGASVIARDISERKQLTEALMRTEKLAVVGRLAATIAHEINNPLSSITNLVYLLSGSPLSKDTRELVTMLSKEVDRIGLITKQTLGFYRQPTARVRLKLAEVVDDLVALYGKRLEGKIETKYRSDGELEGHPVDIRQALANLLLNASDAVGEAGRISIEVEDDDRQGVVRTIIADNGPGIPEHIQEKIFEPFFSTKAERGVGLGLWVAREVVTKTRK